MTNDTDKLDEVTADGFRVTRFKALIAAVEATPDGEFDMRVWADRTECGTVGCAVGSYAMKNPGCGIDLLWAEGSSASVAGSGQDQFLPIIMHFGIGREEALRLFSPFGYPKDRCNPSRTTVLERLRSFLASKLSDPAHRTDAALLAFAGLTTPGERAAWPAPRLPPGRSDFAAAHRDAGREVG